MALGRGPRLLEGWRELVGSPGAGHRSRNQQRCPRGWDQLGRCNQERQKGEPPRIVVDSSMIVPSQIRGSQTSGQLQVSSAERQLDDESDIRKAIRPAQKSGRTKRSESRIEKRPGQTIMKKAYADRRFQPSYANNRTRLHDMASRTSAMLAEQQHIE